MINVLIADDHELIREGLKRILRDCADMRLVGEAHDGTQVLEAMRADAPDVLLLDLSMPGPSGFDLLRRIAALGTRTAVLVLSMHAEEHYAVRAIRAGAAGYLGKESAAAQLIEAIRRVAAGRRYISPAVAEQLASGIGGPASDAPAHGRLSAREFEIFERLVAGASVTDIATQLNLSVKTVSTHKARILAKLDVETLVDAVHYAVRNGLCPADRPLST
ncbi:MAG: response regulator [Lautropia sp.]